MRFSTANLTFSWILICLILISGTKFLCSEVIAPIRSEVDDISLFIINFEDLTDPEAPDVFEPEKLSKCKLKNRFFGLRISFSLGFFIAISN